MTKAQEVIFALTEYRGDGLCPICVIPLQELVRVPGIRKVYCRCGWSVTLEQ